MVAAIIKLNASIKEGRQQAGKNVSEVLSAQRIILCVFISAALFHWSHNKGKWIQRTVGGICWLEEGTSLKSALLKPSKLLREIVESASLYTFRNGCREA